MSGEAYALPAAGRARGVRAGAASSPLPGLRVVGGAARPVATTTSTSGASTSPSGARAIAGIWIRSTRPPTCSTSGTCIAPTATPTWWSCPTWAACTPTWRTTTPTLEPVVEVTSTHGSFEWFLRETLERRYTVGFVGGSDSYTGRPGDDRPGHQLRRYAKSGLTGVYASAVTLEAILDAIQARRCYATTGARILCVLSARRPSLGALFATTDAPGDRRVGLGHGAARAGRGVSRPRPDPPARPCRSPVGTPRPHPLRGCQPEIQLLRHRLGRPRARDRRRLLQDLPLALRQPAVPPRAGTAGRAALARLDVRLPERRGLRPRMPRRRGSTSWCPAP